MIEASAAQATFDAFRTDLYACFDRLALARQHILRAEPEEAKRA